MPSKNGHAKAAPPTPEVYVLPMTTAQARQLIGTDPDFVMSKRYGYSLKRLLEAHPEGCSARLTAAALMMSEEEVEACYQQIVVKLRALMGVDDSL